MKLPDYEQLTLFPEASLDHASHSALPGSEEAARMTVTSGRKCLELYPRSGPVGSLVRMLLESSTWRSTRCCLTWKVKDTKSKRLLFRLLPSVPRTGGTDAQLSGTEKWKAGIEGQDGQPKLWKTPIVSDGKNRVFYHNSRGEPNLSGMVKLWPTPTARDFKGANSTEHLEKGGHVDQIANAVKMFPTPRVGGNGKSQAGVKHGDLEAVVAMYPTPTTGAGLCAGTGSYKQLQALREAGEITEEERRNMASGSGGQLNPAWVEALMGFPNGWTELEPDGTAGSGKQESRDLP